MVGLLGLGAAVRAGMAGVLYDLTTWKQPDGSELTVRCEVVAFTGMGQAAERYLNSPVFSEGQGVMRIHPQDAWPERNATCVHPRLLKRVTLLELAPPDRTGMREGSVSWS